MRQRWFVVVLLAVVALAVPGTTYAADAKFLLVSDIHFNPMADPVLVSQLAAAEPSQWEAILDHTTPTTFSQYGSDTNWWLLKSAMRQLPSTLRHPTLVMVTGDFLAHNFPATYHSATHDADPDHYRAFVLKTVQFLALELQRNFPGTKILITPGNNDNDCGDYSIEANGDFLKSTASVARDLAGGDDRFVSDWKSLGSFSVPHPALPGVRIISINSIFLSQKYQALSSAQGCTPVSSTAAADLLTWLEQDLAAAAQANQKVWLMFHIPPGIDGYASAMNQQAQAKSGTAASPETCSNSIVPMWVPEWTAKFDALLKQYHSTVIASFAAHTHSDDYRLLGTDGATREFVLMNPAISPIYSQNPGFRVVSYNRDGVVTDQSTYYLTNLASASAKKKGKWKKEYTFTRQWKSGELNAASLGRVYDRVVVDDAARANWLKLYAVSGPALEGEKPIARELYCAVEGLSVAGYRECDCGTPKR